MDNAVVEKSKSFAIRIVRACKYLTAEKNEYVLSKQLLRSGTSIGANVKEAIKDKASPTFIPSLILRSKRRVKPNIGLKYYTKPSILIKSFSTVSIQTVKN